METTSPIPLTPEVHCITGQAALLNILNEDGSFADWHFDQARALSL